MKIEQMVEWSNGNIGAAVFLQNLARPENKLAYDIIIPILEDIPSVRGTNLYVLWSDICDKDISKVVQICHVCSQEMLEDACSSQDRSGKKIIQNHLKELYADN